MLTTAFPVRQVCAGRRPPAVVVWTSIRWLATDEQDAHAPGNAVEQAVELLKGGSPVLFALAPEGTRTYRDHWKTGFYRIARKADVPVVLAFLDFGRKRIGLGPTIYLTGDPEADLEVIRGHYADVRGRVPEKASAIRFPENADLSR